MLNALQYAFNMHGRLNHVAFLLFYLACGAYAAVAILLYASLGDPEPGEAPLALILALLPGMAAIFSATVRRLHDRGRSGSWLAIFFVPAPLALWLGSLLFKSGVLTPDRFDTVFVPVFLTASIPLVWGGVEIFFVPGTSGANRFGPQLA